MRTHHHLIKLANEGQRWMGWYAHAKGEVQRVSDDCGWCWLRFADVLAVTSPRLAVRRNVRVALHYMRTGEWLTAVIYATRCAMLHYEETGEIRGRKTSAFAAAIKGDLDAIVLDTWMAKAFEIEQRLFERVPIRRECELRIQRAARECGYHPAQCQAAVWAGIVLRAGRHVQMLRVSEETVLWDALE